MVTITVRHYEYTIIIVLLSVDTVATRKLIYYGAWRERSVSKQQTTEWVAGKKWNETNKFLLVECHLRSAKISTKHIHAARGNDSVLKRV